MPRASRIRAALSSLRSLPIGLLACLSASAARAAPEGAPAQDDFLTPRYEPAAFPLVGGNSDIGVQLGVAGSLSDFGGGVRPYVWKMDVLATASVAPVPGGVEIAQQAYVWNSDVPGLAGGRLRMSPYAEFRRTVNQGYFGLGNASSAARPAGSDNRYFEYIHEEADIRQMTRYRLSGALHLLSSTLVRYVSPTPYPGSRLAGDAGPSGTAGSEGLLGVRTLAIMSEGAGVVYDSRDSEIFTRSGWFGQLGARGSAAFPLDAGIGFSEAEATLAGYARVGGVFVLAAQAAADFKFGHVPFFELFTGGVFKPDYMIGGSTSVRGVPFGRYLGTVKGAANVELRGLLLRARWFGQSFQFGGDLFFDTGRVWSDYTFHSALDGGGLGLKWGTGVGGYLLWGQSAMFRLDVAHSPDAAALNPGFPFAFYVEDGLSF